MNTIKFLRNFKNIHHIHETKFRSLQPLAYSMSTDYVKPGVSDISKERKMFQDEFSNIMESLKTKSTFSEVPEVANWVEKISVYNIKGGKQFRASTTTLAYEMLENPKNINEETMRLAHVMGWCVEMLHGYFLLLDDIMDGSSLRRGVACWHRLPGIGLTAINDSILLYSALFETLKINFGDKPHYVKIIDAFNKCLSHTVMGQYLDTLVMKKENDYDQFTMKRYEDIAKYKTSYYTFTLPITLGLLLANNTDQAMHKTAEDVSLKIGLLFQIQDDYIDCYGDESVSGKDGTDIQEGKCSWLAVQALKRCTPEQRKVFEKHYSINELECVERIRQLYGDLKIPELYREFERSHYESLVEQINSLPPALSPALFTRLVDMIYKRVK